MTYNTQNRYHDLCFLHGLETVAWRDSLKTWLLLEEVEPLLAEGGLGPAAGLGTMRPSTGASVVAPAAIIDFTHPSPARQAH